MSKRVLDASVIIAAIRGEQLSAEALDAIQGAVISSVNLAEVLSVLTELGLERSSNARLVFGMLDRVEPFTEAQARKSGEMRPLTRRWGLSLGDRACLALGMELGLEVLTADRAWAEVEVGCRVRLIR